MGFEEENEMAHEEIKMYLYALMEDAFMNRLYDIHQQFYGVPCGPTLEMVNETNNKRS